MSMQISNIDYIYGSDDRSVESLAKNGEINNAETLVFKKIFGLHHVKRFRDINHECLLNNILELYGKDNKLSDLSAIHVSHTGDLISPYGVGVFKNIFKNFNLYKINLFSSTGYNCATPFLLLKHYLLLSNVSSPDSKVMIIICDIAFTKILKTIPGVTLMSDVVVALTLSFNSSCNHLIDVAIQTYPEYSKGIWDDKAGLISFQKNYSDYLCKVITDLLNNNDMDVKSIKYIFPHNVNIFSWTEVSKKLSIPKEKIYLKNIPTYAHAFGADPFINLKNAIDNGHLNVGDYYVCASVGLGAVFAAALFQY